MNSLRKIFTVGVMMITILSLSVVVAPSVNAAASAGDLIKMNGLSSVYYLGANGKRYVFPNESTYFSWYKDFSGVVTVPQSELETYPLAANVVIRPGTKLVKSPSIATVYAVEPNGTLRSIVSEANAQLLWGADWNKQVVDVIDSFFTNYTVGAPLTAGQYPAGQLIKTSGSPDVYVIESDGTARKFASEAAFLANNYNWDFIETTATSFVMPAAGSAVNGAEDELVDVSQGGGAGSGNVAGTGISIALASDTPAAATIAQSAPADFLKFNVTASNDGAVNISGIKLTAGGLGTCTNIDNVALYIDGARFGNTKNVDSSCEAAMSFGTPIAVPAGQTKSIVVRAQVTGGTNQHNLSVKAAADITATGASVSGSFPITGNTMSVAAIDVGQLTVEADGAPADVTLGETDSVIAKFKVTNNNFEDVELSSVTLKKTSGTASDDDFENVSLYSSGAKVASSNGISGSLVTFNLTSPMLIEKGKIKKFEMRADVIDGASKDITMSLNSASDVIAMGKLYGTYAKISVAAPLDISSDVNILAGAIALAYDNPANEKVRNNQTNVEFGTIKITPNSGTQVELSSITIAIDSAAHGNSFLENAELVVTGGSYGGAILDLVAQATTTTGDTSRNYINNSDTLTLNSGTTYNLLVRADVKNLAGAIGKIYAVRVSNAATALTLKETGNNTTITDITPNSITLNSVTVESPAITITKNALSASYNAVVGQGDINVLSFNMKANSVDALKVTELKFMDRASGPAMTSAIISNVELWKSGVSTAVKSVSGSQLVAEEATFSNLSLNIPKGESVDYYVTIDLVKDNGYDGTTTQWYLSGYTAEDVTEGEAVYDVVADDVSSNGVIASGEAGYTSLLSARTVTMVGAGSLLVEMDNANTDTNKDKYEIANTTTSLLAAIKMRSTNEEVKVEDLGLDITNAAGLGFTDINKMFAKLQIIDSDKTTVLKETTNLSASSTLFEDVNIIVPMSSKTVYLRGVLNKIGKDEAAVVDASSTFAVDAIVAKGQASQGSALTASSTGSSAKTCASGYVCYVNTAGAMTNTKARTNVSKSVTALATKLSSVELVATGGGCNRATSLSGGWNTVAVVKVTTDNTTNTLSTGEEAKTVMSKLLMNVTKNATTTLHHFSIEKCGGTDGSILATASSTVGAGDIAGTVTFTLTNLTNDKQIAKSSTVYYAVKAYASAMQSGVGNDWTQFDLGALDGDSTTGNFGWYDSSEAKIKYPLRLSVNKIDGEKIIEP